MKQIGPSYLFRMKVLVHLQLHEVPEYLRDSALYKTFRENASDNSQEVFEIPVDKLKLDPEEITTEDEWKHMIATLLFWNSPDLPDAMISFALEYSGNIADLFNEKAAKLPQIQKLKAVIHDSQDELDRARLAASVGSIQILKHLLCYRNGEVRQYTNANIICEASAAGGHIECLQYAHSLGLPWDYTTCKAAAAGGHLECLQYAHSNGCPWNSETCNVAAAGGHLECLQYAHSNKCPWNFSCYYAAAGGHVECLQYAHSNGCRWDSETCKAAAAGGYIECLQYAHSNGCAWGYTTCKAAVEGGHIECLKYALSNGCPLDSGTKAASHGGYFECLQYVHSNVCP